MGNGNAEQPEPLCEIDALRRQLEAAEGSLAELREVAERYRLITEASGDIVNETDSHGRFSFLSSTCQAMLGYAAEELVGTNPVLLVHEDDRPAFLASLRSAPPGQPITTPPHRLRHQIGRASCRERV